MLQLEHKIEISASAASVWAVTADVLHWSAWSPTITDITALDDARLVIGNRFLVKQPMQSRAVWRVTECREGQQFAWEREGGRLLFWAAHEVEEHRGRTVNTLLLRISGMAAPFVAPILRPVLARALRQENQGLKAYCERSG